MIANPVLATLPACACPISHAMTGQDLAEIAKAFEADGGQYTAESSIYLGYTMGLHDAYRGFLFCPMGKATYGQTAAIFAKYLMDHPEKWQKSGAALFSDAMATHYPCKGGH